MSYETIKRNYDKGLWNKQLVRMAVKQGFITADQYEEITGEKY
jgi:uncharacterized XkdX family phage protein